MPTPLEILEGLAEITNRWRALAIVWHVYFGILAAGLLFGVRPSKPAMGILLAIPLFSVGVLAWLIENPFNGTLFALVGLGFFGISFTLSREPVSIGPVWAVVAGVVIFVFGWVYPHFLETTSPMEYVYAAPTGLIPCPTLSIIIGLGLICGGLDSRLWSSLLGVVGLFYSIVGAWRLGVTIDLVLLFGSIALLAVTFIPGLSVQVGHSTGDTEVGGPARTT